MSIPNKKKNIQYVSCCLVGHVANGKTTLVKSLTGVNTKRSSSEIKSGRTIKLGYANCLVWKCDNCGNIKTTGQGQKKYMCCEQKLQPDQYVSFIDAPGHHAFVQTMIKGASIVDCAILVVDARKDYLQVQTLEHLAILEILGVNSIIIIQNKIDLVDKDQCLKHYNMLRVELKRTIAENAPIIPCSAQQGIRIETVQLYLWRMVEHVLRTAQPSGKNVFSVIRSFDINKPACVIDDLKGGVLGGTLLGEHGYAVGDDIEIRPGIISSDGTHRPLHTTIRSIFSEQDHCKDTIRGGLYGLGTTLDPTLTKADRLVGALIGRSEDLPKVINELKMTVIQLRHGVDGKSKVPKIKKNKMYQLIIGSNVVQAVCQSLKQSKRNQSLFHYRDHCCDQGSQSLSNPHALRDQGVQGVRAIMELTKPICIVDKKCLIYSCESSNTQLIGFGIMKKEKVQRPVFTHHYEYFTYQHEYTELLPDHLRVQREKKIIPVPIMARENRNTIWSNMGLFCETVHRDTDRVSLYLMQELCIKTTICDQGLRIVKSGMDSRKLQTVLSKYIKEHVMCDQCRGMDTRTDKNPATRHWEIHCQECGSTNSML